VAREREFGLVGAEVFEACLEPQEPLVEAFGGEFALLEGLVVALERLLGAGDREVGGTVEAGVAAQAIATRRRKAHDSGRESSSARPPAVERTVRFRAMTLDTHGRWPWVAAGLVVPAWSSAATRRGELLENGSWVAELALPILVSHQSEEWVWPGGFLPFCNERLLGSDRPDWPLTERIGFHVNVTVGWVSAAAGLALWRRTPVVAAGVLCMEAGNALMHIAMAIRERRYNPGVVTTTILMAPHAFAGGWWLARSRRVSRRQGLLASALGATSGALPLAMKMRMRHASKQASDG
jgi:Protein of unknown function with HXXEE motif